MYGTHTLTHNDDQTIIAHCTPKGPGALALLRMSGTHARDIAAAMSLLPAKKSILEVPTHTIHYGWIVLRQAQDDRGPIHGEAQAGRTSEPVIDQVMFIVMDGPATFTGQNVIEITCHNNQFIIDQIIELAIHHGARLAQHGEFTKRAVLNNKVDLLQAEAINDLIHAQTPLALKKSLSQLKGSLSQWSQAIETELFRILAFCEASFEFIDEEITFDKEIRSALRSVRSMITDVKKTYSSQQQIKEGFRVALLGSVNAGKSSIFNALLSKQRAIVTNKAGTTRDVLEDALYKDGIYWTIVDTAGLRTTDDEIEQEGIKRSFIESQTADVIILVCDGTRSLSQEENAIYEQLIKSYENKVIVIENKADQGIVIERNLSYKPALRISAHQPETIQALESLIEQRITRLSSNMDAPFLLNKRQFSLLIELERKLREIETILNGPIQYEILSHHLNDALAHVSELTGKSISERGMDAIFKQFCVGK
jgi:tRNA modification GTPase